MIKVYKKIAVAALCIQLVLVLVILFGFKVEDTTLGNGRVTPFNTGWTLYYGNGEQVKIPALPYNSTCDAGETLILETKIPRAYWGKTLFFLSADKEIRVRMDGVEIYSFGRHDVRLFGHTPGSITNFVNLPKRAQKGILTIEMVSAYDNYAAYIPRMRIASRDIAILTVLKENAGNLLCSIILIFCGGLFLVFAVMEKKQRKSEGGLAFLGILLIWGALYYAIETKILHVLFGNQTFYSFEVFSFLMCFPILLILYYVQAEAWENRKSFYVVLILSFCNIVIQCILQIFNIKDFLDMSFVSHALILFSIVLVLVNYAQMALREHVHAVWIEMASLFLIGAGSVLDICRTYAIKVGDLGRYSRSGTTLYGILMVFLQVRRMIRNATEETERRNTELRESEERAEKANRAKSEFLSSMSHEIRTPLNAVIGMNEMILRESDSDAVTEYAAAARSSANTLLYLINDILDISKIEAGKIEIIPADYQLTSLIVDSYNMISDRLEKKGLTADIRCQESLPRVLYGDMFRVRQIVINILTNAVKYTERGHIEFLVGGVAEAGTLMLEITVKDTGIGMTPETLERLFNKFERFDLGRNRSIEGTGLGLSITQELVTLMNGMITVESEYGAGSVFTVVIPQQIVDSTPIGAFCISEWQHIKEKKKYVRSFLAPSAEILIVDDVEINRKVFANLLKQTQVRIDMAASGRECLALIQKKRYDMIFMDHMMPDMNGIETLKAMGGLTDNQNPNVPVIMLTANALSGMEEMYRKEGFTDYLAKPVEGKLLEEMVRRYLPVEKVQLCNEQACDEEVTEKMDGKTTQNAVAEDNGTERGLALLKHKIPELDAAAGIAYCAGSEEFYIELLKDYHVNGRLDTLASLYEQNDWENYRVEVHALKSTSRTLGLVEMGSLAEQLEMAAKSGDIAYIEEHHGAAMQHLKSIIDGIEEGL